MAALLRHRAARRLVGSIVQRAQAEERRRLGPRLMHTDEQGRGRIKLEVQQKIDELYDLISKGEQDVRTSTWPNAWLLQSLAKEITPRKSQYEWSDMEETSEDISWTRRACLFALTYVAMNIYDRYSDDKKVSSIRP